MFICYENNKECIAANFHGTEDLVGIGTWDNARFNTFEEAQKYMKAWMGFLGPDINSIILNNPMDYYDSTFIIKEV